MDLAAAMQAYGYPLVLAGSLLEGETVLALGGLAAHRGCLALHWVAALGVVGGFFGDQVFFALGRRYGARLVQRWPRLEAPVARAGELVERRGAWLVVGVRFMYGLRIAGPVAIGMSRIGWLRFAGFNFLGAALWAPLFVGLGYLLGDALERVLGELHRIEHSAFAILTLAGVAAWLGARRYRRGTGT